MTRGLTLSALCIVLVLPGSTLAQVRGQVVDAAGMPVPGVSLWSIPLGVQRPPDTGMPITDENGNFTLDRAELFRFVKPGYRPVTKLRSEIIANPIVRLESPAVVWKAPKCPSRIDPRDKTMDGTAMRFVLPRGTRARQLSQTDFLQNVVCIKRNCLVHGFGGNWSDNVVIGDERVSFFTGVREMTERQMYNARFDVVEGAEYRGVRTDGTYFRWVGVVDETIEYSDATQATAAVFDKIIDSLCWFK